MKDLEAVRPRAILDLIHSAETFRINLDAEAKGAPKPRSCQRCGYICSQVRSASYVTCHCAVVSSLGRNMVRLYACVLSLASDRLVM